jgi:hypothetical protein
MPKKNKTILIPLCGICLLAIAVLLGHLSKTPPETVDPQVSKTAVSNAGVSQTPAGAPTGRKLDKKSVTSTEVRPLDTQNSPFVFYPDKIMDLLGIDADLLKWHQETYEAILSPAEYEALFEFKPEDADQIIDAMVNESPRYSFILNQEIPAKEVTLQVQAYKLEEVNVNFLYEKKNFERDTLIEHLNAGEITPEQIEPLFMEIESVYIEECRKILTDEEFKLIFDDPSEQGS